LKFGASPELLMLGGALREAKEGAEGSVAAGTTRWKLKMCGTSHESLRVGPDTEIKLLGFKEETREQVMLMMLAFTQAIGRGCYINSSVYIKRLRVTTAFACISISQALTYVYCK
jgi:hypothetical protein